MASQQIVDEMKGVADNLWNIYQTLEDMEQKIMDCDDRADFFDNIAMESFDAIGSQISKAANLSEIRSEQEFEFKDLDGRVRKLALINYSGSLKDAYNAWRDNVDAELNHMIKDSDYLLKDFLKKFRDFKRSYMFPAFAYAETVSKSKSDEQLAEEAAAQAGAEGKSFSKTNRYSMKKGETPLTPEVSKQMRTQLEYLAEIMQEFEAAEKVAFDSNDTTMLSSVLNEMIDKTKFMYELYIESDSKFIAPDSLLDVHDEGLLLLDLIERYGRKMQYLAYCDVKPKKIREAWAKAPDDVEATLTDEKPVYDEQQPLF